MKRNYVSLLMSTFAWLGVLLSGCSESSTVSTTKIPAYPIQQGVSAPFAGFIDGKLVVAGGCNFPDIPAAEGGKKVYYRSLYTYPVSQDSISDWSEEKGLPLPIAYGASVETGNGLVCIGGMNENSSLKDVFYLKKDSCNKGIMIERLPPLPEGIDNAAAAILHKTLYVTGGNQGNSGNALYSLCLERDTAWVKLADYPGAKRLQPVLLASDDALYLMGGFEVDPQTKKSVISSNFMVYHVAENRWGETFDVPQMNDGTPRALVGCAGTRVGNKFLVAGGVNHSIFKAAVEGKAPQDYMKRPVEWYQFSKDLLVYDFTASKWSVIPNVEGMNKAGGSLLYHKGTVYMVCGEKKPGIRTSEIVSYSLEELLKDVAR